MKSTLFISYSHKENSGHQWLERLEAFLDGVQEALPLDVWSDQDLQPGSAWDDKISESIRQSSAAVLLVGREFLASKYIKERELPPLLGAAKAGRLRLYLLVVTECLWDRSVLAKLQFFNDPKKPLESMRPPQQNRWLNDLCRKILDDHVDSPEELERGVREYAALAKTPAVARLPGLHLRQVIVAIKDQLDLTRETFNEQVPLRDALYNSLLDRLEGVERLEFEPFFRRHFAAMNESERALFLQLRALTEGPMLRGNREILRLVESDPAVRNELPVVAALKTHLVVWLDKYRRVFVHDQAMCLLYVGVEEGVPFPFGVDEMVQEWLAKPAFTI